MWKHDCSVSGHDVFFHMLMKATASIAAFTTALIAAFTLVHVLLSILLKLLFYNVLEVCSYIQYMHIPAFPAHSECKCSSGLQTGLCQRYFVERTLMTKKSRPDNFFWPCQFFSVKAIFFGLASKGTTFDAAGIYTCISI